MELLYQLNIILVVLGAIPVVTAFFERIPRNLAWTCNGEETNVNS